MAKPSGQSLPFKDLVHSVAENTEQPKSVVRAVLADMFDAIQATLGAGHDVKTPIGSFKRKDKHAKPAVKAGMKAVNPFTKEEYITTAKPAQPAGPPVVKFYPNKALKDAIS